MKVDVLVHLKSDLDPSLWSEHNNAKNSPTRFMSSQCQMCIAIPMSMTTKSTGTLCRQISSVKMKLNFGWYIMYIDKRNSKEYANLRC